ncbi:MAG: V-type ATP synthase subunit C [Halorientalis sp.]
MSVEQSADSGNYEYVTARVRSRRAALFDEDDYRKLLQMGPGEIARFMEESEYETEMDELGSRHSGVDLVEYALNRNIAKHFEDLLRWADGQLYDLVARYLRKFDVWNVKTIIRGLYADSDRETVEADLIRAGEFSQTLLNRLLDAGSIDEVVDMLASTRFGDALAEAYSVYEESGVLVPLENALDHAFYAELLSGLAGEESRAMQLYQEFLRAEVDFRNMRNAFRLARSQSDLDPSEYYIGGGDLFTAEELRQLVRNTDQLVEFVRQSKYGEDLDTGLDTLEEAGSLLEFEHALDEALLEYSSHLSNKYPLSICPVLAYVLAKEREVDNIRAIARGREAGLTEDEIEEELVIL